MQCFRKIKYQRAALFVGEKWNSGGTSWKLWRFEQGLVAPGHEAGGSKDEGRLGSVNTDRIWWSCR